MRWSLVLPFLVSPVWAEDCPEAPDHSGAVQALLTRVQHADTEAEAQQIANEMWTYWADAPNEQAQEILDKGMHQRAAFDLTGALETFNTLIAYCPAYAEGYNQRAFVHFIGQNFEAALPDLDRALDLSPDHVAAMSGKALTLVGLGRGAEAALVLRAALDLNPWLPERSLLPSLEMMENEL